MKLRILAAAAAGVVFSISGVASAQCNDCQTGSFSSAGGWPTSGRSGRFSQMMENHRTWHADYKKKADVIEDRNEAWPKPFSCQDRMGYFATIATMYESGWIAQCCLTNVHFDATTGELNAAGQNKVQAIMNNNPLDRRHVFIVQNLNVIDTQTRLENVKAAVSRWYGPDLANHVAVTDRIPQEVSGQRIEAVNSQYIESIPAPVLQTGSASASGGASGG